MSKKTSIIVINPRDNVAVATEDLRQGDTIALPHNETLKLITDVPRGHKIALEDLRKGSEIIKYGEVIGRAKEAIRRGEWVHTHNMGDARESE